MVWEVGCAVMLIGFQCSESPGPTGGELSGSLGNSMGPDSSYTIISFFHFPLC